MTAVNIKGTFKRDERKNNGLEAIADRLAKEPMARFTVVGVVSPSTANINYEDGGSRAERVKFDIIEVCDGEDAAAVRGMIDALYSKRTGGTNPPDTLFDADAPPVPEPDDEQDGDQPPKRRRRSS